MRRYTGIPLRGWAWTFAWGALAAACAKEPPLPPGNPPPMLVTAADTVLRLDEADQPQTITQTTQHLNHIELDRAAGRFATMDGTALVVHDADGEVLGRVTTHAPTRRHRFLGDSIVVPIPTSSDPHTLRVTALELRSFDDRLRRRIDVDDLRFTRTTDKQLVVVSEKAITSFDQRGEQVWRIRSSAHELATAVRQDRIAYVDATDTRRVIHLDAEQELSRVELRSPIWNLAMAPDGDHSAVTTKRRLYVFQQGRLGRAVNLGQAHGVARIASIAINDQNEMLVGAHGQSAEGRLLLFSAAGELLQDWQLQEADDHGFRPAVQFLDATRFSVEHGGGSWLGNTETADLSSLRTPGGAQ